MNSVMIERENQLEKRDEMVEINMLTDYDQAVSTMAEIEGQSWLKSQVSETDKNYNLSGARNFLKQAQQELASPQEAEESDEEYADYKNGIRQKSFEIYGRGGGHRYYVRGSGTVEFSSMHCNQPKILAKARESGFKIIE